ncbi:hypothetical protein B0H16DRAFT_1537038 [Mycena metata]|uniref:FAD/NAD(P)-binding domain-containing protein n=1 Tax=Mycena metata TaxID=1033252 RepID=A0AAD7J5G5_9AGAR|nr:hypothetical protein B0H16DRAFT_1537038 [Mycena metata]
MVVEANDGKSLTLHAAISHVRQLRGSFPSPDLLCAFTDTEALDVAKSVAPAISALLSGSTECSVEALFHPDAFWRDHIALSWSLRTFNPTSVIHDKVIPLLRRAAVIPSSIVLQEDQVLAFVFPNDVSVVRAPFQFETSNPKAKCTAAFKLIRKKNGEVKVFIVTTALQELDVTPWNKMPLCTPQGNPTAVPTSVDVLVVGGGHAGLSISAYLKSLNINFAMVEKQAAIGDSWRKRYNSTTLHTTRIFSGLPFIPFPSDYPLYVPAKLIAPYYAQYVQELQLPAYTGRECVSAAWDEAQAQWTVKLEGTAGTEIISARNLVFAVGIGGREPIIPDFPGKESFLGESLHSGAYTDASRWAGKRIVIVGASTTACDVAQDCYRAGAETLIVQRGPTRIYPQDHITAGQALFWNPEIPVEVGDVMATEDPIVLQAALNELFLGRMKDNHDPEYYEGLRKAGFLAAVDGPVHQQVFCRGGAHYPDIGACGAISRGEIKVKSGAKIEAITPTGIAFCDGTQVGAGCHCLCDRKDARKLIQPIVGVETAESLEPVWGLDAEGEVRGCWRPSGHDHIWFQGGELQTMRYFGKFLALQIAAEIAKVRPTPCRV